MATIKVVTYQCSKCKAEDKIKYMDDEPISNTFNCVECGAGRGIPSTQTMIQNKIGMFPVKHEEYSTVFISAGVH